MIIYLHTFEDLINLHAPLVGAVHEIYATDNILAYEYLVGEIKYVGPPITFKAGYIYKDVTYYFEKKYSEYFQEDRFFLVENAMGFAVKGKTHCGEVTISPRVSKEEADKFLEQCFEEMEIEKEEILRIINLLEHPRVVKVERIVL